MLRLTGLELAARARGAGMALPIIISLSNVLRRVAYPVEPFGFEAVQGDLPPLLIEGIHHRLGEQPGLFDEANGRLAKMLQHVHKSDVQ